MDRFQKFTDNARQVLTYAQNEALRFNHNYIGTEHLLLGLLRSTDGVAVQVLRGMDVDLAKARTAVEFIIGRGDRPMLAEVGLTPRAKRVIELAIDESRRLGHDYIGTEHILLGLIREGEGIAAGVLESLGVNLDKARHEVIRALTGGTGVGDWTPSAAVTRTSIGSGGTSVTGRSVEVESVLTSDLVRVIGIGQVVQEGQPAVELIALEIREAGALLYWNAQPADRIVAPLEIAIADDVGTTYEIVPALWSMTYQEERRQMKGETAILPAPPEEARTLLVDVGGFAIPGQPVASEDGTIQLRRFEISLA